MGPAFWFLLRRSARNRLIRQLDRIKEPRYAIALLVGLAYLWFFLFGQSRPSDSGDSRFHAFVPLLGSLVLFLAVARWWVFGGDRRALSFTPAEIQFLFPAPIERKALIHWKLLRWQILIVINTLIWIVIARRARPPIPLFFYAVSLWMMFSTLSLHRLGAALTKAGVATHWRTGLRRQAIPLTLASTALIVLFTAIAGQWRELSAACCGREFLPRLDAVLTAPTAAVVLFPFRVLLAPVGAASLAEWTWTIGPAVALLALHYLWVVRSQVTFEEAALQASADTAARLARLGGRQRPAPRKTGWALPLGPKGWPGTAILWKNIIAITRGSITRSVIIGLLVFVAAFASVMGSEYRSTIGAALGTTALALTGFLSFVGPLWIRNDLRSDLAHLDLLKAYPLHGRTVVLAEILASTLTLTVLQLALVFAAVLGLAGSDEWYRYPSLKAAVALALPGAFIINAISLTIQNAAALLFPAWVRLDAVRPGGFETLGQNILSVSFTILLSVITLAGPAITGWLTWVLLDTTLGPWAILPAIAAALGLGAVELGGLIIWLGRVFERAELTP